MTLIACLLAVLVLSLGFVSSEGLSARKKPGDFEYAIANFALARSIPSEAKRLRNPLSAEPQILAEARKHYKDHCAICHAEDGGGKTMLSAGLSPEVPDLRAQDIQELTDGEMFYIIKHGARFTGMPGWDLGDDHSWRLVLLLRQLPKDNPSQPGSKGFKVVASAA